MQEAAREWSDRDLERRFALGEPHDELTQLAFTLDGLLDRPRGWARPPAVSAPRAVAGGEVQAQPSDSGGRFVVRLPAA